MTGMTDRKLRTSKRTWLKVLRDQAWQNQKGCCAYCQSPIRRSEATADHVLPQKEFGTDVADNIVASCQACNTAKGHMSVAEFMIHMVKPKVTTPWQIRIRASIFRLERRIKQAEDRLRFDR